MFVPLVAGTVIVDNLLDFCSDVLIYPVQVSDEFFRIMIVQEVFIDSLPGLELIFDWTAIEHLICIRVWIYLPAGDVPVECFVEHEHRIHVDDIADIPL